jgi:hypothetical protein
MAVCRNAQPALAALVAGAALRVGAGPELRRGATRWVRVSSGAICSASCHLPEYREPWCPGGEYVFLGQRNAHHRRSNYATRIVRPAADGWYPKGEGRYGRPAAPVMVDSSAPWPGMPLSSWPPAVPGEPYAPPVGRGIPRLACKDGSGRCPACTHTIQLRQDGTLIPYKVGPERCTGSESPSAEPVSLASCLPLRPGLTPHGLRHGHQTWLDDLGVRYVL